MEDIVIVSAVRTAVGKFGGSLAKIPATELGAIVIKEALARAKVDPAQVSEVIMGQVLTAGAGQNPARQALLKAGLPKEVPGLTINAVCGSGLKAVMLAAQAVAWGDAEIVVAGGQENMSAAPHVLPNGLARRPAHGRLEAAGHDDRRRPVGRLQPVPHGRDGRERRQGTGHRPRRAGRAGAGQPAEGRRRAGSRQVQGRDRHRRRSRRRRATRSSSTADEFINKKTNAEALAGLRPAFDKAGSVTAGNASGLNDGAAAVVVMSAKKAKELGLKPLATIKAFGTTGLDPKIMGMGPVSATKKALQRAGWKASEVDLFELNEAFAAQACAVNKALDIDPAKVNVNGGAIAIGHPIGASGARILVTLLHEMQRREAKKGIAALCIGGGMGVSLAVERA
jgi:acetyl-CoA C-acetyltransferase